MVALKKAKLTVKENLKVTSKGNEIIAQFHRQLLPDLYKSLGEMMVINYLTCSLH